ncbi:MAG: T9SS type A sorting domain-containing protein [Aequorivita sp.]|nr:T9SS type A sorting domain-containing protein [Aequorivita sp.]
MKKALIFLLIINVFQISYGQIIEIPDNNLKFALTYFPYYAADFDGDGNYDGDVDTNNDGEIDVCEAEAVIGLNLAGRFIESLEGLQYFTNLITLDCSVNEFTSLTMWPNTNIENLAAESPNLLEIDVTQSLGLKKISIWSTPVSHIDTSQNIALEELYMINTPITAVDLSNNINLKQLFTHGSSLQFLDLSQNSELDILRCQNGVLTGLNLKNGFNEEIQGITATNNPYLECIQVDDVEYAETSGWEKDAIAQYSLDCMFLGTENFEIENIALIYPNPYNEVLNIDLKRTYSEIKVEIFDMKGFLVFVNSYVNTKSITLKLDKPDGVYMVKTQAEKFAPEYFKIIKY